MANFEAPPIRTPFPDAKQWQASGVPARAWVQWFQSISTKFTALFGDPPVITGSRGGNVALKNLLAELAALGLVKDETTP